MKALFSPIGNADPMTALGDGPMLHIVRHYAPERVVLFLSPKIAEYHGSDDRYCRAIRDCCKLLGRDIPEIKIIKSEHDEVYRFDYYIEDFEVAIKTIQAEEEDCEVFVNATSGTAGMQQAVVSLGAFGRLGIKLLQVVTPRGDANKKDDREDPDNYEYDRLWSNNPDNLPGSACRVFGVDTPNFSEQLLRDNIETLVESYDYQAASQLASCSAAISPRAQQLISAADSRLKLNPELPTCAFSYEATGLTGLEYRENDPLYEYIQALEVRLNQGQYADFVRSLTPAITETMLSAFDLYLKRKKYLSRWALDKNEYRFDAKKIKEHPELEQFLIDECDVTLYRNGKPSYPFVTNRVLMRLIREYRPDLSEEYFDRLRRLDGFESSIRNKITHQIRRMDKESITRDGGVDPEQVFSDLCKLNNTEPGLYDRINEVILKELQ